MPYRGTVQFAASYGSVSSWGDAGSAGTYTFTATDGGSHVFATSFSAAGNETVTVNDSKQWNRTATSAITVNNSPAAAYSHEAAPAAVKLADGSSVWAYVGRQGRLYARRNAGSVSEPAWRPATLVRDVNGSGIGADSPSLALLGSTLALFHTYTDGASFQIWLVTSTDGGATWSAPVQVTHEGGHVQRIQTAVSGSTLSLFWSRQDTNQQLFSQTTTDLVNWTAKAAAGQPIGPAATGNTTSNFGITKLASGSWLLGWLGTSPIDEGIDGVANNYQYPTVHVAASTDLATWSSATELSLPYSQRWPASVALALDAGAGTIYALFEQWQDPPDTYTIRRTSSDGVNWNAAVTAGYDRSAAADGTQGYHGSLPALLPAGGMLCLASTAVENGSVQVHGHATWSNADSGREIAPVDCASLAETLPLPYGDDPRTFTSTAVTGYAPVSGADLGVAALGLPLVVSRTYNSFDAITGHGGPFGSGWSWQYGMRALPLADGSISVVTPSGRRALFWKSGSTWTAAAAVNATLTAATGGGWVLTSHDQTVLTFNATGQFVSIADHNGNTQTLSYAGNNLASVTAPGGRGLTVTSDGSGRITQISGPAGLTAAYTYSGAGNLATARDASGATTTYTYDSRHQLLTVVDGNNHTVATNTYGSLGRTTQSQDAASKTTALAFSYQGFAGSYGGGGVPGGNVLTDPLGVQTTFYNDAGLRTAEADVVQSGTLVQRWLQSFNANNDLTSRTDPNNHQSSYGYDTAANPLNAAFDSGTGGLNLAYQATYNSFNQPLTVTDPLGRVTASTYDAHGNQVTAVDALNKTTTFAYTQSGQVSAVTDANNHQTTFAYNAAGDLLTQTLPGGAAWSHVADAAGRRTSATDPLGHTTSYTYDGIGRLTQATNALGQAASVTYDAAGNRTSVTDPLGRLTSYGYDARNLPSTVTDALSGTTSFAYDNTGHRSSATDPRGKVWSATYMALRQRATATDPLGNVTHYTYDNTGNLTGVTDPLGNLWSAAYDGANRRSARRSATPTTVPATERRSPTRSATSGLPPTMPITGRYWSATRWATTSPTPTTMPATGPASPIHSTARRPSPTTSATT